MCAKKKERSLLRMSESDSSKMGLGIREQDESHYLDTRNDAERALSYILYIL